MLKGTDLTFSLYPMAISFVHFNSWWWQCRLHQLEQDNITIVDIKLIYIYIIRCMFFMNKLSECAKQYLWQRFSSASNSLSIYIVHVYSWWYTQVFDVRPFHDLKIKSTYICRANFSDTHKWISIYQQNGIEWTIKA